ncbi:MAG TPA: response regulator transcription factor [Actinomycetota bacterium]
MGSSAHRVGDMSPSIGRILLIEDEQRIVSFLERALRAERMAVDAALGGAEGLRLALANSYDLVVLDIVMPEIDGTTVLRRLLAERPSQPVLILSALNDTASKVRCLELGAEDYISKPFSLEELLARVRARLRAAARSEPTSLRAGGISLDLIRREVDAGSGPLALSDREFLLLGELMRNAGTTISKERLLSSVWHYHFDPGSNVVDVCVGRLRAKLGPKSITTVRGVGYRIDAD